MRKLIVVLVAASLVLGAGVAFATNVSDPGNSGEAVPTGDVDEYTPKDVPDNTPCSVFGSPPPNTPQVLNNGDPVPKDAQEANDEAN